MSRSVFLLVTMMLLGLSSGGVGQAKERERDKPRAKVKIISHVDLSVASAESGLSSQVHRRNESPFTLGRLAVAVDGAGYIYAYVSLSDGATYSHHQLIKYDATGKIIATFRLPEYVKRGVAGLNSLTLYREKLYAPAAWHNEWGEVQGGVLIFSDQGDVERLIELPLHFTPDRVLVAPSGIMYIAGTGPQMRNGQLTYVGSPMVLKLDSRGRLLKAFSPLPAETPDETLDLLSRSLQNELLLDDQGHLLHILPDARIRVFSADGEWLDTLSPSLRAFDFLSAAFWYDGYLVLATDRLVEQRASLYFIDRKGEVVTRVETTGQSLPVVAGHDGFYYGVARLASSGPEDRIRFRIIKLDLSAEF